MVFNNFARTDLSCPGKRNLLLKPRSLHKALSFHHESHTVNQSDLRLRLIGKLNLCRLLRDKFRFCGHDRLSRRTLREFIAGTVLLMLILNIGEHHLLHKPLDERRFSGSHRPDNPEINLSLRPRLNVFIYIKMVHADLSPQPFCPTHLLKIYAVRNLHMPNGYLIYTTKKRKKSITFPSFSINFLNFIDCLFISTDI